GRRVAAGMRGLGHGRGASGGGGARRLARRGRRLLGLTARKEHREQGPDKDQDKHPAEPDQPALAHLPLSDAPLLLLAAVSFSGLPALAFVLTRHRSRPPWPVAPNRLPLVFTGGRPTNPMHTSDPQTQACSGL